jgi:hypothetical protein
MEPADANEPVSPMKRNSLKTAPRLEQDTPLRPRAVAEGVWEEASLWLGEPLPRRWLRELIAEANTVYAHNARFRRRLRANSDAGREHLWMFARHWLAALMQERRPHLYARLPREFSNGEPLSATPAVCGHPARQLRRPVQRQSRRVPVREYAWAAAAHSPFDINR